MRWEGQVIGGRNLLGLVNVYFIFLFQKDRVVSS